MKKLPVLLFYIGTLFLSSSCSKKLEELEALTPYFTATVNGQAWVAKDYMTVKSGDFSFTSSGNGTYSYRLQGGNLTDKKMIDICFDDLRPGEYIIREKKSYADAYCLGWLGYFDLADQPDSKFTLAYKTTAFDNAPYVANGKLVITRYENNRISGTFEFAGLHVSTAVYYGVNASDKLVVKDGRFYNIYVEQ